MRDGWLPQSTLRAQRENVFFEIRRPLRSACLEVGSSIDSAFSDVGLIIQPAMPWRRNLPYHPAMFGSHLSIAGGMVNALLEAKRLKMDCVQVFTKNQRQWKVRPLDELEVSAWLNQLQAMNWDSFASDSPARVVSHNSYLINLASPNKEQWKRSVESQRIEVERCETLHIPLCVTHPGAHLNAVRPVNDPNNLGGNHTREEVAGLKRIIKALDAIHRNLPGYRTITCLETTVGSGSSLGYSFHQLAMIRNGVKQPERVGFCVDTCHVTAAGYDMTSEAGAQSRAG